MSNPQPLEGLELLGFAGPEQRSATAKVGKVGGTAPSRTAKAKVGKAGD